MDSYDRVSLMLVVADGAPLDCVVLAHLIAHNQVWVTVPELDSGFSSQHLLDIFLVDVSPLASLFEHPEFVVLLYIFCLCSCDAIVMLHDCEGVSHSFDACSDFGHP